MPWTAIAVVVATMAASQQNSATEAAYDSPPPTKALDQIVREHQARVAAETSDTLSQAKTGLFLLLALVGAVGYAVYQFL